MIKQNNYKRAVNSCPPVKNMYNLNKFSSSKYSLVVINKNKRKFSSRSTEIKPLINFIKKFGKLNKNLEIYDKYVGRAAALLIILLNPKKVFTPVISNSGIKVLNKYGVNYVALKKVKKLMGIASEKMCKWEMLAKGHTPRSFWRIVKKI